MKGFQLEGLVRLTQLKDRYAGEYAGILTGIRASGILDIKTQIGKTPVNWERFQPIQRGDGYDYGLLAV